MRLFDQMTRFNCKTIVDHSCLNLEQFYCKKKTEVNYKSNILLPLDLATGNKNNPLLFNNCKVHFRTEV